MRSDGSRVGGYAAERAPDLRSSGFGALHLELAELAHHVTSSGVVEPVDVEHPVQVVGLVLEDPREQAVRHDVERAAVRSAPCSRTRPARTVGWYGPGIDRQPSSSVSSPSGSESRGLATKPACPCAIVVDEARRPQPDLVRGQADAGRRVHRLDHVRRRAARRASSNDLDGRRRLRGARGRRAFGSASRSRSFPTDAARALTGAARPRPA